MKKLIALILTLTFIFALAACEKEAESSAPTPSPSSSEPEPVPEKKVGISMPTHNLQRWERDGLGLKDELEDAGYEVDLQFGGDNDIPTQVNQIEAMISGGCGVLVIAAIDGMALTGVLEGAKAKEIPVIAYDRLIMGTDAISYYASFNNYAVGDLQVNFILDALGVENAEGSFNMELFTGDPGDSNIPFFYLGGMKVLQTYLDNGKLVVSSGQIENHQAATDGWRTDKAQERMKELISSQGYGPNGKKLDAVWCINDSIARGVTEALLDAGYTAGENFPIITGQDCDLDTVKNILAGTQSMSIFKDTRDLVSRTVTMINSIMNGEEPEVNDTDTYYNGYRENTITSAYLCAPIACTAENYKELLIESGYYTEEELK